MLGYIFCCSQYMRSSAKFRTVFSEGQSANPLDPQVVAVSPYGWLMTHYGWLAGLSRLAVGLSRLAMVSTAAA